MHRRTLALLMICGIVLSFINYGFTRHRETLQLKNALDGLLVSLPMGGIVEYELKNSGSQAVICRVDNDQQWMVVKPYFDLAARQIIDELKAFVVYARANVASVSPVDSGLLEPSAELTLRSADDAIRIFFGRVSGDGDHIYAAIGGLPEQIFSLPISLCPFLNYSPDSFRSMSIFPSKIRNLQTLVLEGTSGGTLVFQREERGWMLIKPLLWPVDISRFDALLEKCWQLRAKEVVTGPLPIVTDSINNHVKLIMSSDAGIHEVEIHAQPDSNTEMARVKGRDFDFFVSTSLGHEVRRASINTYRQHSTPLSWKPDAIRRVEIRQNTGQVIRMNRLDGEHIWQCDSPYVFFVEPLEIKQLLDRIAVIPIDRFLDPSHINVLKTGFSSPKVTVTVIDFEGRIECTLSIGNRHSDGGYYAKMNNREESVVLSSEIVSFFSRDWYEWQLKQLVSFELQSPQRLSIQRNGIEFVYQKTVGDAWQMVLPKIVPADDRALYMGPLSQDGLGGLRALTFVGEINNNLNDFGLDPPSVRVVVDYALPPIPSLDIGGKVARFGLDIGKPSLMAGEKITAYYAHVHGENVFFHLSADVVAMMFRDYVDPSISSD